MGILSQLIPLVKPLTALIGPAPLFYIYRSWQSIPASVQPVRRPLPRSSIISITILLIASFLYLGVTLLGRPEHIFYLTKSRFVVPSTVLQTRLAKLRPLTPDDYTLIERLATSLSERLNYAVYGPTPLIHCSWCLSEHTQQPNNPIYIGDATYYLLFSLPQLIAPYLFHAFILGVTTTPFLTSTQTTRNLRTYISYALGLLLIAELWILATFDGSTNASAHELKDVEWLHWDMHSFRYTCLAIISALQAGIVYAFDTSMVVLPPSETDRMFQLGLIQENVAQRMKFARTVRSVVMQNPEWRGKVEKWWNSKRVENVEIPEELRQQWEADARRWVDGMIQIEQ
jgi:hypothetical protein